MPQIFKIGSYVIYFWANEGKPLEPVHVHIIKGVPAANATKIWITKAGRCLICNNNSGIQDRVLYNLMSIIETRSHEIIDKWNSFFGQTNYYC